MNDTTDTKELWRKSKTRFMKFIAAKGGTSWWDSLTQEQRDARIKKLNESRRKKPAEPATDPLDI
jgi:hypothetical protein